MQNLSLISGIYIKVEGVNQLYHIVFQPPYAGYDRYMLPYYAETYIKNNDDKSL